jgi:hypothetical protein
VPGAARRHPWWTTALAIVVLSGLIVHWAGTRPSYDAYGWLVWGYQTLHLSLDLGGAPSWKPLPYLFTVPYALLGHDELDLWMVTAVALALAGAVFGGRIAWHVVSLRYPGRTAAAWAGAVFAGAAVLGLQDYAHYVLSVQSDPVIVTFVLAGVDAFLHGRERWAFWLGLLAALGRPEAWCLLGPYSLYLWVRRPGLRRMVAAGWALILFMWFGVPTITNDRPFVSAQLAMGSPRELRSDQLRGTIGRFHELYYLPMWLAVLGAFAWAAVRRDRVVVGLVVAAGVWVATEIAFALHGWPGLPRYMFEAGALCGVAAGIAFGWLVAESARAARAARGPLGLVAPAVAVLAIVAMLPGVRARFRIERTDLLHERARSGEINRLRRTFAALGGEAFIRGCGRPVIDVEWASALAYYLHLDVGFVGYRVRWEERRGGAIVIFEPLPDGWSVRPHHSRRAQRTRCATLHTDFVYTPRHPDGALVDLS